MLTLHYPLEFDNSLTRRWPEKTCFRMQGRAMSEYVVLGEESRNSEEGDGSEEGGESYRCDLICYVYYILSQHADSVHYIDVSLHADSAHSIDVSQHGDIALPARGRPFTHQTLAREDVLSNAGSRDAYVCRLIHARHRHVATQ